MLELKNISFEVDGEHASIGILKNINLTIDDAKLIAITGPNGGGKSTLAKIITGIEKPTGGQILLDGQDITNMSITERANAGISFAFQQPVRFKGVTVKDLIRLASGKNLSTSSACEYLSEVGLCARDYINREVNGSLSGGELKRIDEPEAGIDLWSFNNLIRVFEKLHQEIKGSIVIISHQERILNIADEIIVISAGEISKTGTKDEIMPELLNTAGSCKFYKGEN
jgi:Fe-S cluster assembly ATP-binding protein